MNSPTKGKGRGKPCPYGALGGVGAAYTKGRGKPCPYGADGFS